MVYLTDVDVRSFASEAVVGPDGHPSVALVPNIEVRVYRVQDIFEMCFHLNMIRNLNKVAIRNTGEIEIIPLVFYHIY